MVFGAHCAVEYPSEKAWTAHVGRTKQSDITMGWGQVSKCTDLIIHKEFTIKTYDKDVALLRLETELVYNNQVNLINICFICLYLYLIIFCTQGTTNLLA